MTREHATWTQRFASSAARFKDPATVASPLRRALAAAAAARLPSASLS